MFRVSIIEREKIMKKKTSRKSLEKIIGLLESAAELFEHQSKDYTSEAGCLWEIIFDLHEDIYKLTLKKGIKV